jgi:hypothetical protein
MCRDKRKSLSRTHCSFDSGRQCVLIARLAAVQVAAFEKLSAEGARTLTVVNERYR